MSFNRIHVKQSVDALFYSSGFLIKIWKLNVMFSVIGFFQIFYTEGLLRFSLDFSSRLICYETIGYIYS